MREFSELLGACAEEWTVIEVPVSVWVSHLIMEVGSSSFLYALFSTVAVRLENGEWGSRFPIMMNTLYGGRLPASLAPAARKELATMRKELKRLPPDEIVWSFEDRCQRPPWGDAIAPEITDLSKYFVTSTGRDLLRLFDDAFRVSIDSGKDVEIR